MNNTHIVFVYAGDLWIVSKGGGEASRLTTGIGRETMPIFSPDGKTIAFTGEYDGNTDIYTIPATGGIPKRITYHPGFDRVASWTPDGKELLFASGRVSEPDRFPRLFTIKIDGAFPQPVPLPTGSGGAYSPDAKRLAYTPKPTVFGAWKRYRGGTTSSISIADLSDSSIEKIPRDNSNDYVPMWSSENPNKIYFLSDRNGPFTLFSYDIKSKKVTRLIDNNGLDIKSASIGADAIVYEQFGSINTFDLKSGKTKKIEIKINGDIATVRPKYEKVGNRIMSYSLSPTGARAVFEARGEILTVPAEKGDVRNLTNSGGVADRYPDWSPDGKWVAYFSDESSEYALHIRDQKGTGEVKKIKLSDKPSFYFSIQWSPDSKKITYTDNHLNIWYVDIEKGVPVKVDTSRAGIRADGANWSSDSRWLVYTKPLQSWYSAVFVYSLEDSKVRQITDGMSNAGSPVFDKNGKYLYFMASTDVGSQVFGFDMSGYGLRPTQSIYVCVLRKDLPSPFGPESDDEKVADEAKPDEKKDAPKPDPKVPDATKDATKKDPPKVDIDFEKIGQRIVALPVPNRNYLQLTTGKSNILYIAEFPREGGPQVTGFTLHKYDFDKRKIEKILENVRYYVISANGEKILYAQQPNWFIASLAQPIKPGEGKINTDEMQVYVDPVVEWKQMYNEVWRLERDFFYDPNMHGLDLQATSKKYEPYLESVYHRDDLNYLFDEMMGELSVGHMYIRGGDSPQAKRVPGGLLGADYKLENGRYRFSRIFDGENWNPELKAPLTQPGVNISEGDYLLAVNGRNLTSNDNIFSYFESTAGKQTTIKVGPNPDGANSRDVIVMPIESESGLRSLAWIEGNRRKVYELSGGKLAYVYLPDTAGGGYTFFNRYYFSQLDKEGAVIDERFNSGGQAADYVVDYLNKPLMSYWATRDGDNPRTPFGNMRGPKVMLINEYAGSGGDLLPYMFRRMKTGPLIGTRTWGGLIGITGYPALIDGGTITAPNFAFYTPEGQWDIENKGVAPDIEVELDPKAWRAGRDIQLEKGVEVLMEELKKNPIKPVQRPPYPNYHNGKP